LTCTCTKDEIKRKEQVKALFDLMMESAEKHQNVLLPGYTHLIAMPSSFGMWFSAHAESLIDDITMLNAAFEIVDQNPLVPSWVMEARSRSIEVSITKN
jgi:argininosuccinate lyase